MMAAGILQLVFRFMTSRTGILVLLGLALFTWHKVDKSSAVRRAVTGYVADVELAAKNAELAVLKRRSAVFASANKNLLDQVVQANADAEALNKELEKYVSTVDPACRVDSGLLERLHNR